MRLIGKNCQNNSLSARKQILGVGGKDGQVICFPYRGNIQLYTGYRDLSLIKAIERKVAKVDEQIEKNKNLTLG